MKARTITRTHRSISRIVFIYITFHVLTNLSSPQGNGKLLLVNYIVCMLLPKEYKP